MATSFERVLVPTDFTETSQHALDWALDLAAKVGASVTVMHAYEIPVAGFPEGAMVATVEMATQIVDASREALARVVDGARSRGVNVVGLLKEGVAWDEIERASDEINADLIVIGTHGRRGIARALLGSVAEKVVRTSHRPVCTIRGPRE